MPSTTPQSVVFETKTLKIKKFQQKSVAFCTTKTQAKVTT